MKKKSIFILKTLCIAVLSTVYMSCSPQDNTAIQRQNEIQQFADRINANPVLLDIKTADTLIAMYGSYVKDFPQDTMSEFYLFQMSNVYQAMKECDSALYCLDRIINEYPNGKKVGAAYFFKGVILKDVCSNTEESIKAFETYIEKFPDSPQVETAKRMIQLDTMKNPLNLIENNDGISNN